MSAYEAATSGALVGVVRSVLVEIIYRQFIIFVLHPVILIRRPPGHAEPRLVISIESTHPLVFYIATHFTTNSKGWQPVLNRSVWGYERS